MGEVIVPKEVANNVVIEKLVARIETLERKVEWLDRILQSQGMDAVWMTPSKAAPILGVSVRYLLGEIAAAQGSKTTDLKCGVHYRHKGKPGASRNSWQINVVEFSKILAIPPEKRKG